MLGAMVPLLPADKVQFNVYLTADLVREVKHACVDSGMSLSAFVERVLQSHLDGASRAPRRKDRSS